MKFYVTYRIEGTYTACVEAENHDEALKLAERRICDVDFGEAEDVAADPIYTEDQAGNRCWEAYEEDWGSYI